MIRFFLLISLSLFTLLGFGQQITVKGVVSDKETGETLPFILVDVPNTNYKVTTDIDGNYELVLEEFHDSLRSSCFGYQDLIAKIKKKPSLQVINLQMVSGDIVMDEVELIAPENPAFPIMRNVMKNKPLNDRRSLDAYEYEVYAKTQLDIDNLTEEFKAKKRNQKISEVIDSSGTIVDEYGNEVVPIFISETVSDFYYRKSPYATRKLVKASRITGVGVKDESFFAQIMGASFQDANFYENSVEMSKKQFVSPLSSAWKSTYQYVLIDTVVIEGNTCFELEIKPKRVQDLAFSGTIWITDSTYALQKMDVSIPPGANLNFIDGVNLKISFKQTSSSAWLATKMSVLVNVADMGKNSPGMLLKMYTEVRDLKVNEPKDKKFYDYPLEIAEDATEKDADFWEVSGKDSSSVVDRQSFQIIDSLTNSPAIKTYVDVVDFIFFGYKRFKKFDVGPYIATYAYNEVEEHRFRLGFRTNTDFSKKIELSGYGAYGTGDEKFKYKGKIRYIANRKRWTEFGFSHKYELERLGLTDKIDEQNRNVIFKVFSQWGKVNGGYYNRVNELYAFRQLNKNFSQKITARTWDFDPVFDFAYYTDEDKSELTSRIQTAEIVLRTHFGKNETFVQKGNERRSRGVKKLPQLDFQYTFGVSTTAHEFDYHKFEAVLYQRIGMNALGSFSYALYGGKIFNPVPYPLLNVHLGNEFPIYNDWAFSLMNFFEFVSDEYVSLRLEHRFEGFLLNRIPLMRKLKWRAVVNMNSIWGRVSDENVALVPPDLITVKSLNKEPYVEVGYGIENIFRLFRVEMFHRLNYLDDPNVDKWGIKIGLRFAL